MMELLTELPADAPAIAQAIIEHIEANELDEAEALLARMHDVYPETREVHVFAVTIALVRGRPHEAWQIVNGLPDDRAPELKAICLKVLDDPSWHGYATAHEDSADPYVRAAMRRLLERD
ncbi:HrpB1 family type III secretion system apparatus protein [Burkholderia sp. BCC1047]|uniref:HrpB1 family type III secretion system apparatus protein n=1 Tax=Burkholderia sp. BCC1047 TaxID=2676299 RepID=UPI00158EA2B9|nr:HrpB1 family type III secretion system apparatus protein [Burkholderia sp. BCC1047]